MSIRESAKRPAQWTVGQRRLAGAACILLAAASLAHYVRDLRLRSPVERFARRFSLDHRHPLEVAAMRLEPSGDLACAMVVHAALREKTAASPPPEGAAPVGAVPDPAVDRREMLLEARDLMLRAIAVRPGWPVHLYLLGETAAELSGESRGSGSRASQLWADPLRQATAGAPGTDAIAVVRGSMYLKNWPQLDAALRAEAPAVLQRAFLDPSFVSREFGATVRVLGVDQASPLLPDAAKPLRAAVKILSREGDIRSAAIFYERFLRAERSERADSLRRVEQRDRLGDLDGKRKACWSWVSEHSINDFDDAQGRAEVARLLELWPDDQGGSWSTDPRAEIVTFFLSGREREVKGEALSRAIEVLAGVPSSVRARAKILAGDASGAIELTGQAESDPLEWTPFFVDLARFELRQGRPGQARAALERVSSTALDECDVLLVRRDVARVLADARELESVVRKLESAGPAGGRYSWSAGRTLSLCIDPARAKSGFLAIATQSESPAIVTFGWDGGRSGVLAVPAGESALRVPLAGVTGRRTLSIRALAGGPVRPGRVTVEHAS